MAELSAEEKARREKVKQARMAAGAGTQAAQQMGYIDPNTANNVMKFAGTPGKLGALIVQWLTVAAGTVAALFAGVFAFLIKGLLLVKGIVLLPFIWPFLLLGAIFLFFKKIFDD